MENHQCLMGKSTISMAIFNSYVRYPHVSIAIVDFPIKHGGSFQFVMVISRCHPRGIILDHRSNGDNLLIDWETR